MRRFENSEYVLKSQLGNFLILQKNSLPNLEGQTYFEEMLIVKCFLSKDKARLYFAENCDGNELPVCNGTFEHFDESELTEWNDKLYSDEWLDDNTFICDNCDERELNESEEKVNGRAWCQNCVEEYSFRCDYDGNLYHTEDSVTVYDSRGREQTWERNNAENNAYLWDSDGEYHIEEEPEEDEDEDDNPGLRFFHCDEKLKRYYGIEIEMENHCERTSTEFCSYHSDGSLDNGIEMVTMPFTKNYWVKSGRSAVETILKRQAKGGAKSYDTDTCGVHIHVSKDTWKNQFHVKKTLEFIHQNAAMVLMLSRRKSDNFERWCSANAEAQTGKTLSALAKLAKKKGGCRNEIERYCALNITPATTNEFRIFRGTLSIEGIDRYLEIVDSFIEFTGKQGLKELGAGLYYEFVNRNKKEYPQLYKFLVKKGKITPKVNPRAAKVTEKELVEV